MINYSRIRQRNWPRLAKRCKQNIYDKQRRKPINVCERR